MWLSFWSKNASVRACSGWKSGEYGNPVGDGAGYEMRLSAIVDEEAFRHGDHPSSFLVDEYEDTCLGKGAAG
jgi:hypothetical protein